MTNVYNQYEAAFSNVSAFVIMNGSEQVARIVFKFPKDGAGRLYAYVHYQGVEMVRGYAGGYGYDKKSAAVENAACKLHDNTPEKDKQLFQFTQTLLSICGQNWDNALRGAGFTVIQAV